MKRMNCSGQTLLEVLVALSAALIVLGAITVVVLSGLNQSVASKNENLAVQFAQEGMELARGRGNFTNGERFCLGSDGVFRSGNCTQANVGEIFKREVVVSQQKCGVLKNVTVTVSWQSSACTGNSFCHQVPITSCL